MAKIKIFLIVAGFGLFSSMSYSDELIEVLISSIVPLDSTDTEYSERYRIGYQGALFFAAGEVNQELSRCGYRLKFEFRYYEENNKADILRHSKEAEAKGIWTVFGPNHSDHFLVLNRSLKDTPHISALASSQEVLALPSPAFSMYPSNSKLANGLKVAIEEKGFGKKYGVILDPGCLNCRDLFTEFSKIFGKPTFSALVDPHHPNFENAIQLIKTSKVEFVLLPNYSQLSGAAISIIGKNFPQMKFVGGDGWGDGTYGYLTKVDLPPLTEGFAIRIGGSPTQIADHLAANSLSFDWKGKTLFPTSSAFLFVEHLRDISRLVCLKKPKNRSQFVKLMKSTSSDFFKSKLPLAIFTLKNGELIYEKPLTKLGG